MNKKLILSLLTVVALLGCILLTAGCSATKIGDILDDPALFEGTEVHVKGNVGGTVWLSLLGRGAYQVGDGTGNIWIITNQPPPEQGGSVSVRGTVQSAVTLGDQSFGTVISEIKRN